MNFCRLPPDSEPAGGFSPLLRTSIAAEMRFAAILTASWRISPERTTSEKSPPVGLAAGKNEIVGQRKRRNGRMSMALFRHETRAHQPAGIDAARPDRFVREQNDVVTGGRVFAGQRVEQLSLPVARDAGNCQHFTGMHA